MPPARACVTGLDVEFVQDNHSRSGKNVLRGLHDQIGQPQGKLIRATAGKIWDVAVDLRREPAPSAAPTIPICRRYNPNLPKIATPSAAQARR
jgi:hypothetical protein